MEKRNESETGQVSNSYLALGENRPAYCCWFGFFVVYLFICGVRGVQFPNHPPFRMALGRCLDHCHPALYQPPLFAGMVGRLGRGRGADFWRLCDWGGGWELVPGQDGAGSAGALALSHRVHI